MLEQNQINALAAASAPSGAWDSTVAIVIAHDGAVHQFGSGILFRIADESFVVTAAHVIRQAAAYNKTLGISTAGGTFVAVAGQWLCSAEGQYGSPEDPFDVAVQRLPIDAVQRLSGKVFLRFSDIEFSQQSPTAVYTLFGFPCLWAKPSLAASDVLTLKPFQYTTFRYDRETHDLTEFQQRLHLLLDAQLPHSTDHAGRAVRFQNTEGRDQPFPRGLGGISGCSVWRIGDLATPVHTWRSQTPRIVAVQTGVYSERQAIKATRWIAVSTLLHRAFPELRSAFKLLLA